MNAMPSMMAVLGFIIKMFSSLFLYGHALLALPHVERRQVEEVGATGDNYWCQLNNDQQTCLRKPIRFQNLKRKTESLHFTCPGSVTKRPQFSRLWQFYLTWADRKSTRLNSSHL